MSTKLDIKPKKIHSKTTLIETISPRPCSTKNCRSSTEYILEEQGREGVSTWYCHDCVRQKVRKNSMDNNSPKRQSPILSKADLKTTK